jgi:hypothetical protein
MSGIWEQDRRRMIGLYIGRQDKRQGSQTSHDNHLKKIAQQPGVHTGNIAKHITAELMIQLLLRLSTIQNINATPAISGRRAGALIFQNKIQQAETQYRSCFIDHAIKREVRRTTTSGSESSQDRASQAITSSTAATLVTQPRQGPHQRVSSQLEDNVPIFFQTGMSSKEKKRRSLPERMHDVTLTTESGTIKDDVKLTELPGFVIKQYKSWNDVFVSIGKGGSKPFTSLVEISNELYRTFTGKVVDAETKKS